MKCCRFGLVRAAAIALTVLYGAHVQASGALAPVSATHRAMGTEFTLTIYAEDGTGDAARLHAVNQAVFAEIDRIEALITTWQPDSQVSYLNRHAAESPVRVNVDVLDILIASRTYFEQTGGAFDCTVGPLSRLYGLYDENGRVPSDSEIADALMKVGSEKIDIDRAAAKVSFKTAGVELDFGGIGKGFAIDRAVEILRKHDVTRALIDGGTSTVFALGAPPGEDGWTVRVRHPYNRDDALAEVVLRDESLSTSGCYDLVVVDGVQVCNIFDPRTGLPRHGMLSATAIAPTATETDALSTAFLVMGVEEVREFQQRHPRVRAIMVPESPGDDPAPVWIGEIASPTKHGSTP